MKSLNKILTKGFLEQKYWTEELSTSQIAKAVGCGNVTVLRYLKKHNIPRRTYSEALKGRKLSKKWRRKISETLKGKYKGKNNFNWNGGRIKDGFGYVLVLSPNHPYKNNHDYVREHRLVVEKILGRYLLPTEIVHHINGKKDDNRIENLICFVSNSAHRKYHKDPNSVKSNEIIFDGRKIR